MRFEVDKYLDYYMKMERVLSLEKTFNMKKNDIAALPDDCNAVIIGLGWDCPGSIDIDASIICLDGEKN